MRLIQPDMKETEQTRGNRRTEIEDTQRRDGGTNWLAKAWTGKRKKPYSYLRFKTEEQRDEWVEQQLSDGAAYVVMMEERKEREAKARDAMRASIEIGSLFVNSWGYDQTNLDFYEVIDFTKSRATVTLREIAGRPVDGSQGSMCEQRTAAPGAWTGQPFQARVNGHGVSLGRNIGMGGSYQGTPTTADASHYCSWYA